MGFRRIGRIVTLGLRHFRRSRLHALLAIAAAVTGTGGVAICTGYAAGGRQKIFDQFRRMGTNMIVVTPIESRAVGNRARTGTIVTTLREPDYRALLAGVAQLAAASPTVSTVLRVRAGDLTKSTTIVGCTPDYFAIRNWGARTGSLFDTRDNRGARRVALLGATAARDLFGREDPSNRRILIGNVSFTVLGVLAERGQGLDASNEDAQVYVPLETAMHRLMNIDFYSSIVLEIGSWTGMDEAAAQTGEILERRHRFISVTGRDFQVRNQKALLETQLAAFARLSFFLRWIAVSTLTVASLGIFGVAWIGVGQRVREIGTRRAIGATALDVLVQFFAEGMTGSAIGCAVGIAAAWFLLRVIDARADQPFLFSAELVAGPAAVSLALYGVATLLCCFRAIRVDPSVALRAE
jgi:putative ABC transport system permease protein